MAEAPRPSSFAAQAVEARRGGAGSLIIDSAVLALGRIGAAAVGIVLPIALVRTLDLASVGRYKLFFLIASTLATVLSCGIPASLYYFLPRRPGHRHGLLLRSTALLIVGGVVGAVLIEASQPMLASRFHLVDRREVLLAAVFTAVSLPATLLPVIATTDGRIGLASLVIAGFDTLRALAMVTAALLYRRVDAVLASAAGITALQLAALGAYVVGRPGEVRDPPPVEMRSVARAQLLYALSYQGAILANLVREQAHAYYVASVVAPSAYAVYAVGLLQVPFIGAVAQSLNDLLIVHGSEMHLRGEISRLVALWHRAVMSLALVVLPVFATLWMFAPELFLVLFGPAYAASVPLFRLSLLLLPLSVPLLHTMLRTTGRTGAAARAEILSLVIALGLLPLLVTRFGLPGAALSLVVASLVFQLSGSWVLCRDLDRGPLALLPWSPLLGVAAAAAVSALVGGALVEPLAPLARLIVGGPIALAGYFAVAWFAGFIADEDRARVRTIAARLRGAAHLRHENGLTVQRKTRITKRAPLMLQLSRALNRRQWRGGTFLERLARKLGVLDGIARYELGHGITVDVPLGLRPVDETDVREYESALVRRLASAIEAMGAPVRLFDCGADYGLIALKLVARCVTISRVVAVEPNSEIHPALVASLARLPCRAEAVLAAVGDACGRGELRHPAHDPDSDVSRFVVPSEAGTVRITTIDALAAGDDGCVALKCDVEGSELAVLRGARETLRRAPRFVVAFEAHPSHVERTGVDPTVILRELRELRPCSAVVVETGAQIVDDRTPLFEQLGVRHIVNIVCESVGEPAATE